MQNMYMQTMYRRVCLSDGDKQGLTDQAMYIQGLGYITIQLGPWSKSGARAMYIVVFRTRTLFRKSTLQVTA